MNINVYEKCKDIKDNINKVIIGKSNVIDLVLTSILSGGHILLEDCPGTGKTLLAKSFSKSIDGTFKRIQFTPDLLPSDITGINIFNAKEGDFKFIKGPVFTNILLADEINRATPRTQSSLLEAMEEKQVTIDGTTYKLSEPFLVIATENPLETAGTFPLPEAQLDRFMMQLSMGYPSLSEEIAIIDRFISSNPFIDIKEICTSSDIIEMQKEINNIYVHKIIREYIAKIVQETRENNDISFGVSPRGTLALLKASKSYAAIHGRSYVIPDDIKILAKPVLAHRIIPANGFSNIDINNKLIEKILSKIEVQTDDWDK